MISAEMPKVEIDLAMDGFGTGGLADLERRAVASREHHGDQLMSA